MKIHIIFAAVLITGIAANGFFQSFTIENSIRQQISYQSLNKGNTAKSYFIGWLNEKTKQIELMSFSDITKEALLEHKSEKIEDVFYSYKDDYEYIKIANNDGDITASSGHSTFTENPVKNRFFFRQSMNGEKYISGFLRNPATGNSGIVISVPVRKEENVIGVIFAFIPLTDIEKVIHPLGKDIFVFNNKGKAVLAPDKKDIFNKEISELITDASRVLKQTENLYVYEDDSFFITEIKLEQPETSIVILEEKSLINSQKISFFKKYILLSVIFIATLVSLQIWLLKDLFVSFDNLFTAIKTIARGKLETPVPYKDNFDSLGKTAKAVDTLRTGLIDLLKSRKRLLQKIENIEQQNKLSGGQNTFDDINEKITVPIKEISKQINKLSKTRLDNVQYEIARNIKYNLGNIDILTDDITGEGNQAKEIDFSLSECIRTIVNKQLPKATAKNISLLSKIPEDIPDQLHGDKEALSQILFNLLDNAVRYTHQGHVCLSLTEFFPIKDMFFMRFEIQDTGTGLTEDEKLHIFSQNAGNGIGLPISQKLVKKLGGGIGVTGTHGQGSIFWFTVKMKKSHKVSAVKSSIPEVKAKTEPKERIESKGINILLAEDDDTQRTVIRMKLQQRGYNVDEAHDGLEALNAVRENDYHLVLMDLQMPIMDGTTSINRIRRLTPPKDRVPIIALTGSSLIEYREKHVASEITGFMEKPINWTRLYEIIDKINT